MNKGEATNLNALLIWLFGLVKPAGVILPDRITEAGAKERAIWLANRAHEALGVGITGDQVHGAWPGLPLINGEPVRLAPGDTLTITSERACRVCGCTDDRACEEGCYWVEEDLCSVCAKLVKLTPKRRKASKKGGGG